MGKTVKTNIAEQIPEAILEITETPQQTLKIEEFLLEQRLPRSDINVTKNLEQLLSHELGSEDKQRPTQVKQTHKIPDVAVFSQNESISTIDNKDISVHHSSMR